MKKCFRCSEVKPLYDFSPDTRKKDGAQASCKKCCNQIRKDFYQRHKERLKAEINEYRRANPTIRRNTQLKTWYGITLDDYNRILAEQGNCCAICRKPAPEPVIGRRFHLDHDHSTNVIRGILCTHCNQGLGYFTDDEVKLMAAIKYLRKNVLREVDRRCLKVSGRSHKYIYPRKTSRNFEKQP